VLVRICGQRFHGTIELLLPAPKHFRIAETCREPYQRENNCRLEAGLIVPNVRSDGPAEIGGNHQKAEGARSRVREKKRANNFKHSNENQLPAVES
jgi:hypothetical protein